MNLGIARLTKSWSMPTSTAAAGGVSDRFPMGLRVLIVDDDSTCLMILEKMLHNCHYQVTKCNRAEVALSKLRENKIGFDIVISDVHMPDMDGFKLLEHIGLEMDLPVIMMSADDSNSVVMKGVTHGACDYLIKPVRIEPLKNIWQHVVRKKKHEWKDVDQSGSVEDGEQPQKMPGEADYPSSANEGNWRNSKRGKEEEDEAEDRDDSSSLKKPRVVWSPQLHHQFMAAVGQIGVDKAVPKKILELMNVPRLTRENVASHLQKYRIYMKRVSGPEQNGLNNPFAGTPDATFGSMSSLNSFDLPALAASGQLPAQSLATLQAAALGRSTIISPVSPLDQRNIFSFENPKLCFVEGQPQQLTNNNKQLDFLHGIPTNMEPKQLANLHQTPYSFGGINMPVNSHGSQSNSVLAQMPQSRVQLQNETNGSFVSRIPSSIGQPVLSNGISGGLFQRSGLVDNVGVSVYNQVSQPSPVVGFSISHRTDLTSNSFPLGGNSGISSLTSNELHQLKSQAWGLPGQHVNIQGNCDASSAVLGQQGYSCSQNVGQNRSSNVMLTEGETNGQRNSQNIGQQLNAYLTDNSQRVKAQRFPEANYQSTLMPEQFGEDDLFNLLKQQEAIGGVEHEFDFDGYAI